MESASVLVGKIAVGELEDTADDSKAYYRKGGKKGGAGRGAALTPEQRSEIAKNAAKKRWGPRAATED